MTTGQNASPYARVGAKIVDNGFGALPVAPGPKFPARYNRGEWRPLYAEP